MDSSTHSDSHLPPMPGMAAGPRDADPEPASPRYRWPLPASRGLLGVLVAMAATLAAAIVLAIGFAAAGVDDLGDNRAFTFIATFAGDLALVGTAWVLLAERGRPTLSAFGLRRFRFWPAIGWV